MLGKRFLPVLLALGMLVVLATGSIVAEEIKLVWAVRGTTDERGQLWQTWADEYMEKNPNVKIEFTSPATSYYPAMMTWIAAGEGADIFWLGYNFFEYVDHLMPLDDLYAEDRDIKEIFPAMIQAHSWEGKLMAMPYGVNTHAMYYNKSLLANAGLTMVKGWTWDDAISMAKRLTKDTNGDGVNDQWGLNLYWDTQWQMYGDQPVYGTDGRTVTINNPVTTEAVQLWSDLKTGKLGVQHPIPSLEALLNGESAMGNRGVFDVPKFRDKEGLEWDVAEIPWLEAGGKKYYSSYNSAENWVIWKGTKHPEEAKAFLRFIMSNEKNAQIGQLGAVVPTQGSAAAASFLKTNEPANISVFMNNLNYWNYGQYSHPAYPVLKPIWGSATWVDIREGRVPARTGVPELARQLQTALDEWWAKK